LAVASILTIGAELVSGDVPNSNGSWLAQRLATLGVPVRMIAAVPDEIEQIAEFVRGEAPRVDFLLVTGGLGGTPDDLTREAIAHAFHVDQVEQPDVAADLRARFVGNPEYAVRWAQLPAGSWPLANPLGGAPGFALENVYVMPGLPAEMKAMFDAIAEKFRSGSPIAAWRRVLETRESEIVPALVEAGERWPGVLIGSYPSFGAEGPRVEVVVKSSRPDELREASEWLDAELQRAAKSAADGR
jgi:nicotinamide-nucleotide amidase